MAKVSDWFGEWAMNLVVRSGRKDWPTGETEAGREFWDDLERALIRRGATFRQADDASSAACDIPDLWPNQFRPVIIEAIRAAQKAEVEAQKLAEGGVAVDSFDHAKALSRDCQDCGGCGMTARYVHPEHEGRFKTTAGAILPVGSRIGMRCACPLGKHSANLDKLAKKDNGPLPLAVDRYPEFMIGPADWTDGFDNQFRHHPDSWNAYDRRPIDAPTWASSSADARRFFRDLSASLARGERPSVTTIPTPAASIARNAFQDEFLAILEPERRANFDRMSPARQAQVLALFRDRITDSEVRRALAEIPEPTPKPATVTTPPTTDDGPELTEADDTTDYSQGTY